MTFLRLWHREDLFAGWIHAPVKGMLIHYFHDKRCVKNKIFIFVRRDPRIFRLIDIVCASVLATEDRRCAIGAIGAYDRITVFTQF